MLDMIKVIILGLVEGITEWLPISSTGHLILFEEFFTPKTVSDNYMTMFRVVIQLGAILAVVVLYFQTLNPFTRKKNQKQKTETWQLWIKIVVATIPAMLFGLALDDFLDAHFYNPLVIAITLILYGIAFIYIERHPKTVRINSGAALTWQFAFLIGCFQVLALIPGTSRSGATILGALILGCARPVAAQFSFFLAIPVMFGASALKLVKFLASNGIGFGEFFLLLLGMVVSFFVSLYAIRFLMNYVKRHDFTKFGFYRIGLGVLVLIVFGFMGALI
ncbi:MAG: undecaprenyl-diphosphate phosphatase [Eubacteriales bacterium]|nr:undecaprenyl-diphosphate phosphatase [Eubacteriales bacterium]